MKVEVKLDPRKFIRWTRRNLTGTESDIVLLLMAYPEGLTAEELMEDLNIKSRALGYVLLKLKKKELITDYRRYSGRKNLKLRNSKIKVYKLAIPPERFLK